MKRGTWEFAAPTDDVLIEQPARRRSLLTSDAPLSSTETGPPPPGAWAASALPPMRVDYSQADARVERRKGFGSTVHYLDFDLVAEVRDVCTPLAEEIVDLLSAAPLFNDPRAAEVTVEVLYAPGFHVARLAQAVHRLRRGLADVLAGVLPAAGRARIAPVMLDAAHTRPPVVDNESLQSGSWADVLVAHVEPLSADLAELVAARPKGFVSDLDTALSDALSGFDVDYFDQAVRLLEQRIVDVRRIKADWFRHQRAIAAQAAERETERSAEVLRKLGLS